MEAAGDLHGYVGQPRLPVAEHVLDDPAALHTGDGVLDPNPDPPQPAVGPLLPLGQFAPARLFFSPGRSSPPGAHSPGTRRPCTGWSAAGTEGRPRRRCAC